MNDYLRSIKRILLTVKQSSNNIPNHSILLFSTAKKKGTKCLCYLCFCRQADDLIDLEGNVEGLDQLEQQLTDFEAGKSTQYSYLACISCGVCKFSDGFSAFLRHAQWSTKRYIIYTTKGYEGA